jgi:hypothetical protein
MVSICKNPLYYIQLELLHYRNLDIYDSVVNYFSLQNLDIIIKVQLYHNNLQALRTSPYGKASRHIQEEIIMQQENFRTLVGLTVQDMSRAPWPVKC